MMNENMYSHSSFCNVRYSASLILLIALIKLLSPRRLYKTKWFRLPGGWVEESLDMKNIDTVHVLLTSVRERRKQEKSEKN